MTSLGHHGPQYECDGCTSKFYSQRAVNDHMRAKRHYINYCYDCERQFQNASNYQAHRNSKLHRGANQPCPFCNIGFVSATGLFHHLESSTCTKAPNLNRHSILQIFRARDPHGHITDQLSTEGDGSQTTYVATNEAFNGRHWECYFCHSGFSSKPALNAHLNSAVHQQKVYRCPNRQCGKEFASLASLCNHLESESCGFIKYDRVQKQLGGMMSGNRMIAF